MPLVADGQCAAPSNALVKWDMALACGRNPDGRASYIAISSLPGPVALDQLLDLASERCTLAIGCWSAAPSEAGGNGGDERAGARLGQLHHPANGDRTGERNIVRDADSAPCASICSPERRGVSGARSWDEAASDDAPARAIPHDPHHPHRSARSGSAGGSNSLERSAIPA